MDQQDSTTRDTIFTFYEVFFALVHKTKELMNLLLFLDLIKKYFQDIIENDPFF